MPAAYQYDVALSFAGEERAYVTRVADALRDAGVTVFYDEYEEVALWGKDLYSHLDHVYREQARYCVLFLSENYARKVWTNHERASAQARALEEHQEYVLPARFDNTAIDGLRPTISYVSLVEREPEALAQLIVAKIGGRDPRPRFPDTLNRYFEAIESLVSDYEDDLEGVEFDVAGADGPEFASRGNRDHWEYQARMLYQTFTRMTEAERIVVGSAFAFGCPGELPELVHIDPIEIRRITNMTDQELSRIWSDVRHLGFTAIRRDLEDVEIAQIVDPSAYDLAVSWWNSASPASEDSTTAARALFDACTSLCCLDHGLERLRAADFLDAG
jgi:hypothetical protein